MTLFPLDVVATAPSTEYDFISRYFWPASGGDEDYVTGHAVRYMQGTLFLS